MEGRQPKRRKDKYNPYEIYEKDGKYYVSFRNGEKEYKDLEIGKNVYEAFNTFELQDVFLYQPEFPWLNSSNIYLLTLLNADTFSFASHLSPAILHSGLNSFPLFQFRFIIFQVHKKSLIAFITHAEQLS